MFAGLTQRVPILTYLREVRDELQKVTWPTRKQTIQKTTLVVAVSVVVGLYIGLLDYLFTQLTGLLIK
jgi:preprotein translocase subunit SecE